MDKNQIVGFVLILMIVIGWSVITAPSQEELERQKYLQDSIKQAELALEQTQLNQGAAAAIANDDQVLSDSMLIQQRGQDYGIFASSSVGEEQFYTLENELLKLKFSNKGGIIKEAVLKEHKKIIKAEDGTEVKVDLKLLEDEKNRFEYILPIGGKQVSTMDLFFKGTESGGNSISFVANAGNGSIVQTYTVEPNSYHIDYDVQFSGLQNSVERNTDKIQLKWLNYLDKLELNETFEKFYTTTYYKEVGEDSDYCSCRGDDEEEEDDKSLKWVSGVNQFFNTSIISKDVPFDGGNFEVKMMDEDSEDIKLLSTTLGIPFQHNSTEKFGMALFIGPNDFERLKSYDNGLEEIIPYGRSIFGTINRYLIRPFFNWLNKFISSKGIVIIVLIFIIKMLLYPLMYKMLHSQAKMSALKPDIAKMTAKFKDDPQKKQMETMKLYREFGVSPLGGCLPMAMQMPIWYALFRFFPADITFRQEPFLWASDLSSYDVFFNLPFTVPALGSHISLFTILWAVSTVLYTYYNTKHMDMSANPAMKYVQYFMPLMFVVFFNNYASGLTCYMFFSTLFNIIQTVVTKKFVFDEDKIRKELQKEKEKPKKKGGFQAKLEEAMKQQQKAAEQKANSTSKNTKNKGKRK
jgi:YidC/Oxa1 family membrane protein insertase